MGALHIDVVFAPQPLDCDEVLLETLDALLLRRPETAKLDLAVTECGAEDQASAGHDVDGGELFGQIERLVQRDQHHTGVEAETWRLRAQPGEKRDLLQHLQWPGAVMRGLGDGIVSERLGEPRLFVQLLEAGSRVFARVELPSENDAKTHHRLIRASWAG